MTNENRMRRKFQFVAWVIGLSIGACAQLNAAVIDLASVPLASSSSTAVRPNILFTLDDSGSMDWSYLPDYAGGTTYSGGTAKHCKVSKSCGTGEVPYQANEYNGMAYNPRLTYHLPVNADGTLKPSQGSPWTAVKVDGYGVQSTSTISLTTGYPERVYCDSTSGICKRNGVDTNNPFLLRASVSDDPPVYALPGSLPTGATVLSTPYDGVLNRATSSSSTVYNGKLDITTAKVVTTLTVVSLTHSNSTVTVDYTNVVTPPLVTGDTVLVSGSTCSSGWTNNNSSASITVVSSTRFTYTSSRTSWNNTSCTVVATHPAHTAAAPKISKTGNTVTVTLASAPTPALATGNLVTVGNGPGTCDAGYKATSVSMTRNSTTSFSYSVGTAVGTATDTSCNITQTIATPPTSPGISLDMSNGTVTVYLNSHGLATGDLVQVSDGSGGTCGDGFKTSGPVTVTRVSSSVFTFAPPIGIDTTSSNCRIDKMLPAGTVAYTSSSTRYANPYYFVIIPTEYCDSIYLTNCVAATAPIGAYTYPAPVRFCKDDTTAALPPGDAGAQTSGSGTINCQAKYSVGTGFNFQSVRYGLFWRGDIVSGKTYGEELYSGTVNAGGVTLNYSNTLVVDRSSRSDCAAAPNCTYTEEMTNFANWYAYYHTRMQMMKSSAGRSFLALDNRYRVGFATINESASKYLPIATFDATQKTNWYATFYAINPGSGTPLREAMADAGRYFAGMKPGMFTDDPMEYACQQNFELITTDGYWNGTASNVKEIDGTTTMRNYDNVNSGASKRVDGAYDGAVSGAEDTLADVAMYYYKTDLRTGTFGTTVAGTLNNCTGALGTDVCQDIVPMTPKDTAAGLAGTQHMSTYALGLSDGLMTYQPDYENASTGDFYKIRTGASGCAFSGSGTCNWPLPVQDSQTALDDLWHAAVNGRGTYYNARDPASLSAGLSSALEGINVRLASASASATSSPNITQTDRSIFSSTYRTTKWDGEVKMQLINATTGNIEPAVIWSAQAQLDILIHADPSASKLSRHVYTFDDTNSLGNHLKDFLYGGLTISEQAYFDSKCTFTLLTQCTTATLTAGEIASGNDGSNLVSYLRGGQTLEASGVFRARDHLLGDTVNAKPVYVKLPLFNFSDTGYAAFKTAQATRQGALYMGSNDGMLHAFNSDTGAEMWAYVPKIVMPNLYKLADTTYATLHQYYVDGSPQTMDIYDATLGWRTMLVGALGLGGRGFYALDVTDPANPAAMWEICSDSTQCAISDSDLGYSYGNPVITKRSTDGKWVVLLTSGYNNVTPGTGRGTLFVLDAVSGAVIDKVVTGAATDPPSGLAKLSPWVDNSNSNMTARYVYGGDLNGDVWRFDLGAVGATGGTPTVTQIASLKDNSGVAQSVTTSPELGDPLKDTPNSLSGVGNPGIFVATGRYLGATDVSNMQVQSVYAIKDDLSKTGTAAYIGNPRSPQPGFGSFVRQYVYQPTATTRTTSTNPVNWTTKTGWYADFLVNDSATNLPTVPSVSPGERVNIDPLLVSGTLIVATNIPETSACTIGGTSWVYFFDILTGTQVTTSTIAGFKLGNALTVGFSYAQIGGGLSPPTDPGFGGGGQAGGSIYVKDSGGGDERRNVPIPPPGATSRFSWRELMQ